MLIKFSRFLNEKKFANPKDTLLQILSLNRSSGKSSGRRNIPNSVKHVNSMLIQLNQLNLLNKYIGRMVEVRIRNYEKDQELLDPPQQIGDLVHKFSFYICIILTKYGPVNLMASSSPMVQSYRVF